MKSNKQISENDIKRNIVKGEINRVSLLENGELIGSYSTISFQDEPSVIRIYDVEVPKHLRGKGYGNMILADIDRLAKEYTKRHLRLFVNKFTWKKRWYKKHGYFFLCHKSFYFDWMEKMI